MELNVNKVNDESFTLREKEAIKKRDKYTCQYCNCTNSLIMTVDHKTPLSRGGKSTPSNAVCCCVICNQIKGGLTEPEFKQYTKALSILKKLNKVTYEVDFKSLSIKYNQYFTPHLKE